MTSSRRSARRAVLAFVGLLGFVGACATWVREGDEQKGTIQKPEDFDRALDTLLRPGSVVVLPFGFYPDGELNVSLQQWAESGSAAAGVVFVGKAVPRRLLGVGTSGALSVLDYPSAGIAATSSAAMGSDRLLRLCINGVPAGWRFDADGCVAWAGSGTAVGPLLCVQSIIGPSSVTGRVAGLWRNNGLWAGSLELGADQAYSLVGPAESLPDSTGTLRFIEETATGFATVIEDAGTWKYSVHPASGTPTEVTTTAIDAGGSADVESVRRESGGALLVATENALYRWHVESDASVESIAGPPSGIGDDSWTATQWFGGGLAVDAVPNSEEPSLNSYRAFRSRSVVSGAWDVVAPPATPCTSDAACRQFGESRLVGVLAHGATPWAIYELWAWEMLKNLDKKPVKYENLHTVVAVPLFNPVPESSCAPAAVVDGGTTGTGGTGGTGGAAGSSGSDAGTDASLGGSAGTAGGGGSAGADASAGGTGGSAGAAGTDAGVGGSGGTAGSDAGADSGSDSGTGGSAAIDSMISKLTPYEVAVSTNSSLVLTGEGFDSSHKIHYGSTTLTTNYLSSTQISASLTTTLTNSAGLIEVWAEGSTPATRTNIAYLRVYRTTQPEIVDYIRGWGLNGNSITIVGRRFTSLTYIADPNSNFVKLTLGAQQMWNGELMDTGTFTLGNWTSGQFVVDDIAIPFKGRDFRVEQNLAAATGATVTASTQQTGWEAARAVDGDIGTSWFSSQVCAGVCTATGPTLRVTLAAASTVARIKIRGNREKSTNYDFLRSRLTLEGAGSSVLWTHEYTHPAPERDVDVVLPAPVNGVVAVVFEGREDLATASGIAEIEVYSN